MGYLFPEVKHVVLDEVQNFRDEDGGWLEEARKIVHQHSRDSNQDSKSDSDSDSDLESNCKPGPDLDRDSSSDCNSDSDSEARLPPDSYHSRRLGSGQGFLWIFIDNDQVNHTFGTGIPHERDQIPSYSLTKVIRNSKNVFNYAKTFLRKDAARQIEMGHDFEGEEGILKKYPSGLGIATLRRELQLLFEEGYSKGDIVILFGKKNDIPSRLSSQLGLEVISDAEENDSEHVVVSTFRMYSGLERPVVIMLNINASVSCSFGSLRRASLYCAVTRAMVKLIVLEEEERGFKRKHGHTDLK